MHGEAPKRMKLTSEGPGEVTAGEIEAGADIEILNPDHVICTLDEGAKLRMELTVADRQGLRPGRARTVPRTRRSADPGRLRSTPRCARCPTGWRTTRVGQVPDYDKLTMRSRPTAR